VLAGADARAELERLAEEFLLVGGKRRLVRDVERLAGDLAAVDPERERHRL
jgi:hypothetical protein